MLKRLSSNSMFENARYYDDFYARSEVDDVVGLVEAYQRAIEQDRSHAPLGYAFMYFDELEKRVAGKRILELGFGTGLNALLLAKFGAEVVAVELVESAVRLLDEAARRCGVSDRIQAIAGDFSQIALEPASFDMVIGKAFLHHLTHEQEDVYLAKIARLLKPCGEARFTEPAINMQLIDKLRYWIPTRDRPSKWSKEAFLRWRIEVDRHPDRNNSSGHFLRSGDRFFHEVLIFPWDGILRLLVFVRRNASYYMRLRKWLIDIDRSLPAAIREKTARSQTILMRRPKQPQDNISPPGAAC